MADEWRHWGKRVVKRTRRLALNQLRRALLDGRPVQAAYWRERLRDTKAGVTRRAYS
jgi:hypothetical protein